MTPFENMDANFGSGQSVDSFVDESEDVHGLLLLSEPTDQLPISAATDNTLHMNPTALFPAIEVRPEGEDAAQQFENLQRYLDYWPENCTTNYGARQHGYSSVTFSDGVAPVDHSFDQETSMFSDENIDTIQLWMAMSGNNQSPFNSVQAVSDSTTLTSAPTTANSSPDQQEINNSTLEDITSWPAPELLFPAIEDHHFLMSGAASPSQTQAIHPTSKAVSSNRKKMPIKSKHSTKHQKFSCEIRVSKKIICKEGTACDRRGKAWLGTFATAAQRERAHDVGKFFLSTKRNKTFSDPNSEAILSPFKDHVHALPITTLVDTVIQMAKHYGEHGFLPPVPPG